MGVLSIVNCVDNTGVVFVKIIKVFGHSNKRVTKIGGKVVTVIPPIKELYFFSNKVRRFKIIFIKILNI